MYPVELTTPMAKDLTDHGFIALKTAQEVENVIKNNDDEPMLIVINSVCGCAAANARPGAKMSLQHEKAPGELYTVFAGVDREATQKVRENLLPYPPSSPSIALFKNGKLVHMLERHHIEGKPAEMIAKNLMAAYDQYCN
ncbi:MAG: BrxA/BrxB family bacilliredoxin [Saprospirales bacterium]|nr:MAG: BrxA/BrxB family bacilliredoxin [Saprospirales bacterium]